MSERGREGEGGGGSQGTKSAKDLMFLSVGASNHPHYFVALRPPQRLCNREKIGDKSAFLSKTE